MKTQRHLCSQLVTLSWPGGSQIVNLEEIWAEGALLDCEEPVPAGVGVRIRWSLFVLEGDVSSVTEEEFGWQVEVDFPALAPWSPERAAPAHMLRI